MYVRHSLGEARTKIVIIEGETKRKEEELSKCRVHNEALREQLDKATMQRRAHAIRLREGINALIAAKAMLEDHLRDVKRNADSQDLEAHRLKTDFANLEAEAKKLAKLLEDAVTENESFKMVHEGWISPEEHQGTLPAAQERYRKTLDERATESAQDGAISAEQYDLRKRELDEITTRCDALTAVELDASEKLKEERRVRGNVESDLIQSQREANTILEWI